MSDCTGAHMSCHGIQDERPFHTSFFSGPYAILRLIWKRMFGALMNTQVQQAVLSIHMVYFPFVSEELLISSERQARGRAQQTTLHVFNVRSFTLSHQRSYNIRFESSTTKVTPVLVFEPNGHFGSAHHDSRQKNPQNATNPREYRHVSTSLSISSFKSKNAQR